MFGCECSTALKSTSTPFLERGVIRKQCIFEPNASILSCHAATVLDLPTYGLLVAWFGGTHEGHPDVAIWLSHFDGECWSQPVRVADELGVPLWNPVLFRDQTDAIWLFYKIAPTIPAWTGAIIKSTNGGKTWSPPSALPAGLVGPAKNKPITLSNGDILCGASSESWRSWACWVEITPDGGLSWTRHGPIVAPGSPQFQSEASESASAIWDAASHVLILPQCHWGVIQPTIWEYAPGRLKMLMRATRRVGFVCTAHSDDYGRTWSAATRTDIPCPNSGLDAVRLVDGRIVLACNPTAEGRTPLSLLASEDNGVTWFWREDLETEPGEYSYPSIIQAADGMVHIVYTHQRIQIQHVVIDPDEL